MRHVNMGPSGRGGRGAVRGGEPAPATPVEVTGTQRRTVYMAASLLLDYPRSGFEEYVPAVAAEAESLPEPIAGLLSAWTSWALSVGRGVVEQKYVTTFDQQRRCSLELTYYATGDTRQRGQALLAFRELYRAAGWELRGDELPDYLPAVLELCAHAEEALTYVLPAHREGLEVLRTALYQRESPWEGVVEALCRVLPPIDAATTARYQQLIRQGPPAELVGIKDLPPLFRGASIEKERN